MEPARAAVGKLGSQESSCVKATWSGDVGMGLVSPEGARPLHGRTGGDLLLAVVVSPRRVCCASEQKYGVAVKRRSASLQTEIG